MSTSIICAGDGSEPLLSSRVPDLQFADLALMFDHLESEIDADGG